MPHGTPRHSNINPAYLGQKIFKYHFLRTTPQNPLSSIFVNNNSLFKHLNLISRNVLDNIRTFSEHSLQTLMNFHRTIRRFIEHIPTTMYQSILHNTHNVTKVIMRDLYPMTKVTATHSNLETKLHLPPTRKVQPVL